MIVSILVILGLLVFVGLWLMTTYNGLVSLRQGVGNAWSQIEVQLKRRHDLIPNLVSTVKGYAKHEKETLEKVMEARSKATSATIPKDIMAAEGDLTMALGRLMAISEAYPDLKANENYLQLQEELTSTENRVSYARQFYNDSVKSMNTKVQSFPALLIVGMFGFGEEPFFEIPEDQKDQKEPPQVSF